MSRINSAVVWVLGFKKEINYAGTPVFLYVPRKNDSSLGDLLTIESQSCEHSSLNSDSTRSRLGDGFAANFFAYISSNVVNSPIFP